MRIIAFGSSHTTGYNLQDVKGDINAISKFAYPQIVANDLKCECINLARTGNGLDQIYTDVYGFLSSSLPDDIFIIHLPTNTSWFKLITSDNQSISIIKPDSLDSKGRQFKQALNQYYGTLTGDNHFNRLWYINFYSLINLLHFHNKKFVWFADSYLDIYEKFEDCMAQMPDDTAAEIRKIKLATTDPAQNYLKKTFSNYLIDNFPATQMSCGHYDIDGHNIWARTILVPYINERLQNLDKIWN